jgi:hypothetical protein
MKFKDQYEPISIELENIRGETRKFKTVHVDVQTYEKINNIIADAGSTEAEKIKKVLAILFKTKEENFEGYSVQVLTKVFKYINGEIKKKSTSETEDMESSKPEQKSDSDSET